MALLPVTILLLLGIVASIRGDAPVQESAPYKPSGWKPSGPLLLLPPRNEASTFSFSNTFQSTVDLPSANQFNSQSRPLPSVSPTVSKPTSTTGKPKLPLPNRKFPADDTNDDREITPSQQFSSVTFTPSSASRQFAGSDLSDYRNFPDTDDIRPNDGRSISSTQRFTSVVFIPSSGVRQFADSDFSDYRKLPAGNSNDDRVNTPTQRFTSVPFTPSSGVRQFADSDFSDYRKLPAGKSNDDRVTTPTQRFTSVTSTQNRPLNPSPVRRFPEAPLSQFSYSDRPDNRGDKTSRRLPSSTNLNDDQAFVLNSQSALRPSQADEESDDLTQEFPPSPASVREYLPPANQQLNSSRTSSLSGTPADDTSGGLNQYASPNSPDDYPTPPAVVSARPGFAFNSESGYRPTNAYGLPALPSAFEPSSQQNSPRVFFVVLPVRPQQETAVKQQVAALPSKGTPAPLLSGNRNTQASQRPSPRRRHL